MRLLFVEDDPTVRSSVGRLLQKIPDLEVDEAGTLEAALEALARARPDVMLVDVRLSEREGDRGGLAVIRHARAIGCDARIVVFTGMREIDIASDAMRAGANDFIQKGSFTFECLVDAVTAARTNGRGSLASADAELVRVAKIVAALPGSLPSKLEKIELTVIEDALAACEENLSHAARKLGVDRKLLERRRLRGARDNGDEGDGA